jgi:hypothetical protein
MLVASMTTGFDVAKDVRISQLLSSKHISDRVLLQISTEDETSQDKVPGNVGR